MKLGKRTHLLFSYYITLTHSQETQFGHVHSLFLQASHHPDPNLEEQDSPQAAVFSTPPPSRFVSAAVSSAALELMLCLMAGSLGMCLRVVTHLVRAQALPSPAGAALYLSAAGTLRRQALRTRVLVMFPSP